MEHTESFGLGGAGMILAERQRQVVQEGWTPEHDDEHDDGALLLAAGSYASYALGQERTDNDIGDALWRVRWPWSIDWWKPSDDPIRNLVKAGALIAAEIDRLERGSYPTSDDACTCPDYPGVEWHDHGCPRAVRTVNERSTR